MKKFKTWIKQFQGANSPFGDLAGDIATDEKFPESDSYNVLHDYLENTAALDTFENAWKHYNGQADTKIAHYQLGMRLEFARLLLMSIQCSPEVNEILHGRESSLLEDMIQKLTEIKSSMEDLAFKENKKWANTDIYYGNSEVLAALRDKAVSKLDAMAKENATEPNSQTTL